MKHVCVDYDVTECFLIQEHVDSVLANHKSFFWGVEKVEHLRATQHKQIVCNCHNINICFNEICKFLLTDRFVDFCYIFYIFSF